MTEHDRTRRVSPLAVMLVALLASWVVVAGTTEILAGNRIRDNKGVGNGSTNGAAVEVGGGQAGYDRVEPGSFGIEAGLGAGRGSSVSVLSEGARLGDRPRSERGRGERVDPADRF